MIEFALGRAGRIVLSAIGPLPSCVVARTMGVRARRGTNELVFAGSVRGRRLRPGTYVIAIRPPARDDILVGVVRVTRRGASAVGGASREAALAACAEAETSALEPDVAGPPGGGSPGAGAPERTAGTPQPVAAPSHGRIEQVLGASGLEHIVDEVSPTVVAIGTLAILATLAASVAGGTAAFLRRRRQPG